MDRTPRVVVVVCVAASLVLLVVTAAVVLLRDDTTTSAPPPPTTETPSASAPPSATAPVQGDCPADEPPSAQEATAVVHVAPSAQGDGSGSTPSDAAPLSALPRLLEDLPPGGAVRLASDAGTYELDERLTLRAGGSPGAPVSVGGEPGQPRPVVVGTRPDPPVEDGESGPDAFVLADGADHLLLHDLELRQVRSGIRFSGDVQDVAVVDVAAGDVQRLIEDDDDATVTGLRVRDVQARGFSRAFARLRADTSAVRICDVLGDSQRVDLEPFAQGLQLEGTVHDVVVERATMLDTTDARAEDEYWNGDGFSAEREVYDVVLRETTASGHTDAGYDLKSSSTRLEDVTASDNKRNFRLWSDVVVDGCASGEPRKRGGTGSTVHLQALSDGAVRASGCTFAGGGAGVTVFEAVDDATLTVLDSTVEASRASVATVGEAATLDLQAVSDPQGRRVAVPRGDDAGR